MLPRLDVLDAERVIGIGVISKTTSGRIICLRGIWSIVLPPGSKCAGGSTCVPYCPTIE